jgi:hypothetical protein
LNTSVSLSNVSLPSNVGLIGGSPLIFAHVRMAGLRFVLVLEAATLGHELQTEVDARDRQAVLERLVEVADSEQLFLHPRVLDAVRVPLEHGGRRVALRQRVERGLGGEHAGLDRHVDALQARRVQVRS